MSSEIRKLNRFSHLVVLSELLPASTDWKQYVKQLESQQSSTNALEKVIYQR